MAENYATLVSQCATITAISSTMLVSGDTNFGGIMGAVIDYAEGRIYRDLDLVDVSIIDTTVTCSPGVRTISLSTTQGNPLQIDALNLFYGGVRVPLMPTSRAVIDMIYPSALGLPQFFARLSDTDILLGPIPDQNYPTELQATIRPAPLSASNSSTWITQNTPELMVAACMVFLSGYMRDFGAQSDNPQMAQSWEGQYKTLKETAQQDAQRQKFEATAWTAQSPSPAATPPRA